MAYTFQLDVLHLVPFSFVLVAVLVSKLCYAVFSLASPTTSDNRRNSVRSSEK